MRASERAYAQLREEIISGQLTPGTVLAEVEQSARLGVSRTPLREALSRLSAEGLTTLSGRRGVVVSSIAPKDVRALFELRRTLECAAASLAAQRSAAEPFTSLAAAFEEHQHRLDAGPEAVSAYYELAARLDSAIDEGCGNSYLSHALQQLRPHLQRVRAMAKDNPQRLRQSAQEHSQICQAIALSDPGLAAAAVTCHLHASLSYITASFTAQHDQESQGI